MNFKHGHDIKHITGTKITTNTRQATNRQAAPNHVHAVLNKRLSFLLAVRC